MMNTKELLILRHGKSDWNTDETRDFDRPLNDRGKHNAQQMGQWLNEKKLSPNLIISSPANRALSTAEIICDGLGLPSSSIKIENTLYEASLADLRLLLLQIPESVQRLLLVGHNPSFESLLNDLAPYISRGNDRNLMSTATLAYFQLDSQWKFLQGKCWIQRAKDL